LISLCFEKFFGVKTFRLLKDKSDFPSTPPFLSHQYPSPNHPASEQLYSVPFKDSDFPFKWKVQPIFKVRNVELGHLIKILKKTEFAFYVKKTSLLLGFTILNHPLRNIIFENSFVINEYHIFWNYLPNILTLRMKSLFCSVSNWQVHNEFERRQAKKLVLK
jgi:hypothetical protein